MAGVLAVCSDGDGNLLQGHSWVLYQQDGQAPVAYGTWGNHPAPLDASRQPIRDASGKPIPGPNGLRENLELGRKPLAARVMRISDAQEANFMGEVQRYRKLGENGWQYMNPCSAFAADAWKAATGEVLNSRTLGSISNPSCLVNSIKEANGGVAIHDATGGPAPIVTPAVSLQNSVGGSVGNTVQSSAVVEHASSTVGRATNSSLAPTASSPSGPSTGSKPRSSGLSF